MGTGYSVTLLLRVDLGVIWAGKLGHLEFRSRGRWGKNQEDEHTFISHTKERSRKKPGFGHSRLARRPAAGLMKHLQCGTCASATKMCWGSADVPGPPEQNNDIITNSVTDQTVHKVTGEGGLEYTHTHRGPSTAAAAVALRAGLGPALSQVPRWSWCPSMPGFSPNSSECL